MLLEGGGVFEVHMKKIEIPLNEASAVPGKTDPGSLAANYQDYLAKSLAVFIRKVAESFQISLNDLIEKSANLDRARRFSPGVYIYYDQLKEGYRQKNLHEIFDALQSFKNLSESDCYVEKLHFSSILTDEWERVCLPQMRSAQSSDESVQMLPLIHWTNENFPPSSLSQALDWMQESDPAIHEEFKVYVSHIKLYAGKVLESSTSARFFGSIYLRTPYPNENAPFFYFRNIVHELSHLHLYALAKDDVLVLNEERELFCSPLRADKRPMIGVFHAVFVLARMVRAFRKYLTLFPEDNSIAESMLKTNRECFLKGLDTINTNAKLTKKGEEIFNTLEECAFS